MIKDRICTSNTTGQKASSAVMLFFESVQKHSSWEEIQLTVTQIKLTIFAAHKELYKEGKKEA